MFRNSEPLRLKIGRNQSRWAKVNPKIYGNQWKFAPEIGLPVVRLDRGLGCGWLANELYVITRNLSELETPL